MDGNQLPTLPPNASKDQQTAVINEVIAILNDFSRDVVGSNNIELTLPANTGDVLLMVPHYLGYIPQVTAYLNDVPITVDGIVHPDINFALPTYLVAGPDGVGHILFQEWIDFFVDETNVYFHWNSSITYMKDETLSITYYLTRLPANKT